jgi:hypothetical protein
MGHPPFLFPSGNPCISDAAVGEGFIPISAQIRIPYDKDLTTLNRTVLLRALSIRLCLILGQFWNAVGIESLGTTACWTSINQNSNSRQGLLTLWLPDPSLPLGGAGDWISPGGNKFRLLVQSLNQESDKEFALQPGESALRILLWQIS